FEYDDLNRLLKKWQGAAGSGELLASYAYDSGSHGVGHRTAMTDTTGTASWAYDTRGRATSESKTITGVGTYTTAYTYDPMDRVKTVTYPTGEIVNQTYNAASLLASVSGANAYASGLTYNIFGQINELTLGNGAVTSYDYYGDGGPA